MLSEMMNKYGADNIRWYMLYVSQVWTPLKFSENGVKEVHSNMGGTSWNKGLTKETNNNGLVLFMHRIELCLMILE